MKLNCIIDTCSCICLSQAEFRQNSLLHYLNAKAILNYSHEVHVELRDHSEKGMPEFIHDKKKRLRPMKYSLNEYERRMVGKTIAPRIKNGNKGEIDNYIVSVDQIHQIKKNSIIFITDDRKALNGILSDWIPAFPAVKIWTSYEVVLYLYAENSIPSKDIAFEMIREIIAFSAPKPIDRSEKTTKELIALTREYSKRIEKISALLK